MLILIVFFYIVFERLLMKVNELLKKQALDFEEKLLRQGIVAAEKEKELHELLREEQKQIQKVTASRDALLKLVEQYKGMLGSLLAEKEKAGTSQEEKLRSLEAEKQQAMEDLSNVEAAFSDVHRWVLGSIWKGFVEIYRKFSSLNQFFC